MMSYPRIIAILLPLCLLITGCGGGSGAKQQTNAKRGTLISATLVRSERPPLGTYIVDSYKLIYSTIDTNKKPIRASGLLSIPKKDPSAKSPLLSYQHGTIFTDDRAPSNHVGSIQGIGVLAGTGYIVSSADYIGYAESTALLHPYVHAPSLASAALDMLRASKAFLANKRIQTNNQLFLTGYSEGGYATLALQKALQNEKDFTVTASAAGAGPYDLSATAQFLAKQVTNEKPAYMNFVVKAYDSIYQLNKIDEMYQAPYRDIINTYFDGSHAGGEINKALPKTTTELFEPAFLELLQGDGKHPLKTALAKNNLIDWTPKAPTRLYHGVLDEIVPYSNSEKALQTMEQNGATQVSLRVCPLNSHSKCAVPYVFDAVNFLGKYAQDL